MPLLAKVKQALRSLIGVKTGRYQPIAHAAFQQVRNLPAFHREWVHQMLMEPTVRLGLAYREAPLVSAELAWREPGGQWIPGVQCDDERIKVFCDDQWARFAPELGKVLTSQMWGWSGCEVVLEWNAENQVIQISRLLLRHYDDVRPIIRGSEVAGVQFSRVNGSGTVKVYSPNAMWHPYRPEPGQWFGESVLKGAFSPWCDKWLDGGALDVRRLFMHKDAYGGVDMKYPEGSMMVPQPDGTLKEVPNRDIAREVVEQIKAGGVTTSPSGTDSSGKDLWTLTRATIPSNPVHILEYPKDLDREILRGINIPDDVLTSEATGAWAGKQVPMLAFYTMSDSWLADVIRDFDTQVLRPLVRLNYGTNHAEYRIRHKPLAIQSVEQVQAQAAVVAEDANPQPSEPISFAFLERRGHAALDRLNGKH